MKKVMFSIAMSLVTAVVMAQTDKPVKLEVAFKDAKMDNAYKNYLQLKDALVASKKEDASDAAGKLKTSLSSIKGDKPDRYQEAIKYASKISTASSIDEIRKMFAPLSMEMATIVKNERIAKGMLYLEYCPMANNNTGAYWLSNEKEIKNPYFGDKMLKCGSVKEVIQ